MSQPISYYIGLITSQYQNAPKFLEWLSACLMKFDDAGMCTDAIVDAFDIDQAQGAQLDRAGEIIGQSRTVGFQPSDGVNPVLDDDTYRLLLKAKVAQNHWDGKISSLQPLWQQLFPGGTIHVQDHQDMSISITLSGSFTSIVRDLINNGYIVPRPQAVLINQDYATGNDPLFGFDRNDTMVAGFDLGQFA